ncbi:hypothetical protein SDC9_14761 [bioreactor metagenome]|uniref:DUF192 domain-containing protein n=1 Tax=bioreactor metagenome TaxID=1076179 RepID=A0A644TPW9_9ZZZZ|nr:DUF192 domain-containing protein [Negativicutes bacterium]
MKVKNHTKQALLANQARMADSFFKRLRGLLGTKQLPMGEGLIIKPCSSVHTFGMAYHIDVLFIDKDNSIVKIAADLGPRQMAVCSGSAYVIELPAGTATQTNTVVGDQIRLSAD